MEMNKSSVSWKLLAEEVEFGNLQDQICDQKRYISSKMSLSQYG